ncbi:MAG: chemotaxis protein CheA [Alphaproteobacteria bacterium]|nr:chemotaxis protein CheA [Alphaproteobacteria bacterium]
MDPMAEIRVTFFQECEDQLAALEAGLLTMEEGDTSPETLNAVFRAVHSIKGGAGAFKLDQLVDFAHVFETALDRIRDGSMVADGDVLKLLLRAADVLADLVTTARAGLTTNPAQCGTVAGELEALLAENGQPDESAETLDVDFAPIAMDFGDLSGGAAIGLDTASFSIAFRPHRSLFEKANEPLALLRELCQLGVADMTCDVSRVPTLDELDPGQCYLDWTVVLATTRGEAAVREIFEFVDGDCDLAIIPHVADMAETAGGPQVDQSQPPIASPVTEAMEVARPQTIIPARLADGTGTLTTAGQRGPKAMAVQATIRVDLDRVDRLINLVGELVINQAMLTQRVIQSGHMRDARVATSLDELEHLTRDLQESVMAIRAQPVRPLFQRMSRIVREVAEATGKCVRLRTEGESTEVDKTVLELLADPLTHMIRNAVDHGIEKPEDRLAADKPAEGIVRLSAAHRSGRVVIEISDDGAGLNRPRILQSAIAKGLVPKDAVLSEAEIDNLLFLPGFSTASTVSNISGRGVGMDVVKRSIQALGGRITTSSRAREGSTFTMSLPLTLAVLDGIIVSIDDQTFVIPLTAIVETLKLDRSMLHSLGEGAYVMRIRSNFVPLIDVGAEMGVREATASPPEGVAILVENEKGNRYALLVDGIQDQRQVVIKSLETNYDRVPGVAAATILGDGRVAMILDVDGLEGTKVGDVPLPDQITNVTFNYAKAS